jgi:hypothetical protein
MMMSVGEPPGERGAVAMPSVSRTTIVLSLAHSANRCHRLPAHAVRFLREKIGFVVQFPDQIEEFLPLTLPVRVDLKVH